MPSSAATGTSCWEPGLWTPVLSSSVPVVHPFLLLCCHGDLSSVQEEDVHLVEHCGWLSVGWKPRLLPLWSAGVWRARLVEAGPEPTSDPQT